MSWSANLLDVILHGTYANLTVFSKCTVTAGFCERHLPSQHVMSLRALIGDPFTYVTPVLVKLKSSISSTLSIAAAAVTVFKCRTGVSLPIGMY